MSASIYVRTKFKKKFYDIETSDFLFRIVKEGCNRRIAMTVIDPNLITYEPDECILSLSDSFNFDLVTPLIGNDLDDEVIGYRSEPLYIRLLNLQNLFEFILEEDIVKKIEVLFTLDYNIDDLEAIDVKIDDFAKEFEPIIVNNCWSGLCYRFIWSK